MATAAYLLSHISYRDRVRPCHVNVKHAKSTNDKASESDVVSNVQTWCFMIAVTTGSRPQPQKKWPCSLRLKERNKKICSLLTETVRVECRLLVRNGMHSAR
eukprot:464779-Pleurochrysis_carterae.AAC.1